MNNLNLRRLSSATTTGADSPSGYILEKSNNKINFYETNKSSINTNFNSPHKNITLENKSLFFQEKLEESRISSIFTSTSEKEDTSSFNENDFAKLPIPTLKKIESIQSNNITLSCPSNNVLEEMPLLSRKRSGGIHINQDIFTLLENLNNLVKESSITYDMIKKYKPSIKKNINKILKKFMDICIKPKVQINKQKLLVIQIPIKALSKNFSDIQKSNFKYVCSQFKEICKLSENTFSIEYI